MKKQFYKTSRKLYGRGFKKNEVKHYLLNYCRFKNWINGDKRIFKKSLEESCKLKLGKEETKYFLERNKLIKGYISNNFD